MKNEHILTKRNNADKRLRINNFQIVHVMRLHLLPQMDMLCSDGEGFKWCGRPFTSDAYLCMCALSSRCPMIWRGAFSSRSCKADRRRSRRGGISRPGARPPTPRRTLQQKREQSFNRKYGFVPKNLAGTSGILWLFIASFWSAQKRWEEKNMPFSTPTARLFIYCLQTRQKCKTCGIC